MTAATVKAGLVSTLARALAGDRLVGVHWGTPGATVVPDAVAVRNARVTADGDEETITLELVISAYVGGGPEAQQLATTRAFALLDAIKAAVDGAPTLSDSCRVAALDLEYAMSEAIGYDASGKVPMGRLAQLDVTVTAWTGRPVLGSLASAHAIP